MERTTAKKRVNKIALSRFEQWALPRMARALPAWVTPDALTGVGLLAAVGIGIGYWLSGISLNWLWLANVCLVIHWWGDSLDGTLARVRRIQRERYGFYVDHQSDAISALLIFGGLALSPLMEPLIAMALLVGYYLLMIMVSLITIARDVFKISFAGLGPTEGRIMLISANTLVWALGNPLIGVAGQSFSLFDLIGLGGTALMLITYIINSLLERATLAKLDPPPEPNPEPSAAPSVPQEAVVDEGGRGL
ncbi:MAG: CDP-alcohol phosphatidyltransferase family protein [Rhodothermaceae bacterium]|nr:CDP-alcohol phosphatidyltransferase family protein [Rhodothermaceae bacterium]